MSKPVVSPNGGSGITRAFRPLLWIQVATIVCAVILYLELPTDTLRLLSFVVLLIGTIFTLGALIKLLKAKKSALSGQLVLFWGGLAQVIAWNPTEGVLFLKNKNILFADSNPHDGGGIHVLFPHLGEELALRVPLEVQTLTFADKEILTKEYMPLAIRGTMYWKVVDLAKFYLLVSKEIHFEDDRGSHAVKASAARPKFEVAEYWLRSMAEEKTRSVVSQLGTGLLIADKLLSEVPAILNNQGESLIAGTPSQSPSTNRSATDGLANAIKSEFSASVNEFGLEIHRVALQEVKLPPEIYAAAVAACKSAYLPVKAKAEAMERKLKLQAEAEVIGKEATGMVEIAKNMPAPAFPSNIAALALQEVLAPFFLDLNKKAASGASSKPELPVATQPQK